MQNNNNQIFQVIGSKMLSQKKGGVPTVLSLMCEDDDNYLLSEEKQKEILDTIGGVKPATNQELTIRETVAAQNQQSQTLPIEEPKKPNTLLLLGIGAIALFLIFKK